MKNDFTKGLFPTDYKIMGFTMADENNNKIINEAIVLDKLNGNKKALLEFYNQIGRFGYRDGILNESAATDIKLNAFDNALIRPLLYWTGNSIIDVDSYKDNDYKHYIEITKRSARQQLSYIKNMK